MVDGWIKLHRRIMESETFSKLTAIQKIIAIYIILNANHEDGTWHDNYKNIEVQVKRGQLITSRNKIKTEWFNGDKEITDQKIRTALKKLNGEFLTIQSTNNYTLITVLNYDIYQKKDNETNQQVNQELTSTQPATNQELTTNKNDKNDKNDKKINESNMNVFIRPTLEQVRAYCLERQNGVNPQNWIDHYTAKGWMIGKNKMKDWKAAVRTWEKNEKDNCRNKRSQKMTSDEATDAWLNMTEGLIP